MKKFFATIFAILYIFSANICYAYNELYVIKNSNKNIISNILKTNLEDKEYTIQKTNPFYAISNKNAQNYVVMILESYGTNYLYYYDSNNDKKLNKNILRSFDNLNIIYEKSYNEVSSNRLAEIAQRTITGQVNTYDFTEPKVTTKSTTTQYTQSQNSTTLRGFVGNVGRGTALNVYLQNPINTATASVGDSVVGVLKEDWRVNSNVIAEQGSVLYGTLTKASSARMGMRNGSVQIDFNRLDTPDGKSYKIVTQKIDFEVTNDGKLKSTLTSVAGAAAVGALLGLAFALLSNGNYGSGAAIGAGAAGGIALATQVAQRGVDAEIPSYTELEVILESDINVVIY